MKIDYEDRCEKLIERQYGTEDGSLVVCELRGNPMSKRRQHYMIFRDTLDETTVVRSFDDARRTSTNVSLVFDGRRSLQMVVDVLSRNRVEYFYEVCGNGWIKALRVGGLLDARYGIEALPTVEVVVGCVCMMLLIMLSGVGDYLEELVLTEFVLNEFSAGRISRMVSPLPRVEYLCLSNLLNTESSFTILMREMVGGLPSLRYLDILGNNISREAAEVLKDLISNHPKLIYLDVSRCFMDMPSFDLVLDGCESTRQMQVLNVQLTIALSPNGMQSLERRISSGSLCLLCINFSVGDNAEAFMQRVRPYLSRHLSERKNIGLIKNKIEGLYIPDVLESIAGSFDGVENIYRCCDSELW